VIESVCTVRRVTPHYCGVCGTEVACVSDLLSERDTRIARAEAELKDERLAFAHANEVVGKLEAELAQLQTAEATIRELDTENEELLQIIADCWAVFGLDSNREEEALPGVIQAQAAQLGQMLAALEQVRSGVLLMVPEPQKRGFLAIIDPALTLS
jgi:septal ring factor EnvC (AmiA/AmiB activator)